MVLLGMWGPPSRCGVNLYSWPCRQSQALLGKAGRIPRNSVFILQGWKPHLGHGLGVQAFPCGQTDTEGQLTWLCGASSQLNAGFGMPCVGDGSHQWLPPSGPSASPSASPGSTADYLLIKVNH